MKVAEIPVAFAHDAAADRTTAAGPAWSRCSCCRCRTDRRRRWRPRRCGSSSTNRSAESSPRRRRWRRAPRALSRRATCRTVPARVRDRRRRRAARPCGRTCADRSLPSAQLRSTLRCRAGPSLHRAGSSSDSARDRAALRRPPRARLRSRSATAFRRRARRESSTCACCRTANVGAVGGHVHVESVRRPADPDFRGAESIARLAQIDERRGATAVAWNEIGQVEAAGDIRQPAEKRADASAHREHRYEYVRRVGVLDRHLDDRVRLPSSVVTKLSITPSRSTVHQRGCAAKRHTNLKTRGVADGSYSFFSGRTSMRSPLVPPNHQSSSPTTQIDVDASAELLASSCVRATTITSPETPGCDFARQQPLRVGSAVARRFRAQ